ncbi:L,D-transpeptidase [Breoghania sp.]|uniref:L,D-transpeptidase n=1 Tax=Breoghania sp. TaxID=2065378 RepID=UPI002AAAABD3|nr:L,D-transpeptidase [Breoghania sp.]
MTRFPIYLALAAGVIAAAISPVSAGSRAAPPPYVSSPNLPDGWRYNNLPGARAAAPGSQGDTAPIWRNRGLFGSSSRATAPDMSARRSYAAPSTARRTTTAPRRRQAAVHPAPRKQRRMDPAFLPTVVDYDGAETPGTIIIDTPSRYLYLVEAGGKARRYGVGVGRPGFQWAGVHKVTRKAEWPDWRPPAEMRKRQPNLPAHMPGGPRNPLGARALYLGSTLYRIHGSNEPWSIGRAVSSGCIRMRNEDVQDLYARVDVGTRVIVN